MEGIKVRVSSLYNGVRRQNGDSSSAFDAAAKLLKVLITSDISGTSSCPLFLCFYCALLFLILFYPPLWEGSWKDKLFFFLDLVTGGII
jgi:hypothetical protein